MCNVIWFYLYLNLLVRCVWGYNLAVHGDAVGFIRSPLGRSGSSCGKPPISYTKPTYFGYDMNTYSNGESISLAVGAPKVVNPDQPSMQNDSSLVLAKGDILSCAIDLSFPVANSPPCSSIAPQGAEIGDSFGMSVQMGADETLVACVPNKRGSCPSVGYSPGYCYRSYDKGKKWNGDRSSLIHSGCPANALDLIFVIDGSKSVGPKNFVVVKKWIKEISRSFSMSDNLTRIGIIQYSFRYTECPLDKQPFIKTEVPLGKYADLQQFNNAVDRIALQGYQTFTAHALNKSLHDFRTSDRFNDPSTSKALILLTDGKSSDGELLPESASYVRSMGIRTFAVGVGEAREAELKTIATGTESDERVYYVTRFDELTEITNRLKTAVLTYSLEGSNRNGSDSAYDLQLAQIGSSIGYNDEVG